MGDAMRYTVSPLVARALRPAMIRKMFAPAPVPERFEREFPKSLMVRPSQLRAAAEDAALMIPAVVELQALYRDLKLPIVIIAGAEDGLRIPAGSLEGFMRSCHAAGSSCCRGSATWSTISLPIRSLTRLSASRRG